MGANKPLVSIIICCHNRVKMLPETLQSVFNQAYRPVEILVFDDGSTDGTDTLIASYGTKLRYYRQENQGVSVARTNACKLAHGEFIAFVDDDDLMPAQRISQLLGVLETYPDAIFATGDYAIIDADSQKTGARWLPENTNKPQLIQDGHEAVLWPRTAATVHTSLFRKSDGEKISWFDHSYKFAAEDKDFFARLGMLGAVAYVPEVVSLYRRGHDSLTSKFLDAEYEQLKLFTTHLKRIKNNSAFAQQIKKRIFNVLLAVSRQSELTTRIDREECNKRLATAYAALPFSYKLKLKLKSFIFSIKTTKN